MVAGSVRGTADARAGLWGRAVADRCAGDPAAWRPDHAREHRVQQGRPDLHRGAGDLRVLFGAVAQAARHPRPVVRRLYFRLWRRLPDPAVDLGIVRAALDATRHRKPADAGLRRAVSLDAGLSLLQPRRAADRRQPRRAVLSCGAGVRNRDVDRLPRRTPAGFSVPGLCTGPDRRDSGVAKAQNRPITGLPAAVT